MRGDASTGTPLVSVVIPCFNHAAYLGEALDSALAQDHPAVEVIVVDDGSTDDSAAVATSRPIVRLLQQANRGPAAARNAGWRASRGSLVVFLDADDRLLPNAISSGIAALAKHPDAVLAFGRYRYIDASGHQTLTPAPPIWWGRPYAAMLHQSIVTMHATALFQRRVLNDVGGYDETLRACEDYDLLLRITRQHGVCEHDALVAEYRQHGANLSRDADLVIESAIRVLGRQWPHAVGDADLEDGFDAGMRYWMTSYANDTVWPAAEGYWWSGGARGRRGVSLLMRHAPWWLLRRAWRRWAGQWRSFRERGVTPRVDERARHVAAAASLAPRRLTPPVGQVRFGSFRNVRPVDPEFGFGRGRPIDRYYVDAFLARHAGDIRGRVLEVKDAVYTRQFGGARVTRADVLDIDATNPMATIVADLASASGVPSDTFDCIVLTQTLHLIYDVPAAVRSLYRALVPGGVLLLTVPGITKVDTSIPWFWSFTPAAARRAMEEAFPSSHVDVEGFGNVLAAVAFLEGLAVNELSSAEFDVVDPEFPVCVAVRATKPAKAAPSV